MDIRQTDRQTDRHVDSMTDPAQRAESVKSLKIFMVDVSDHFVHGLIKLSSQRILKRLLSPIQLTPTT